MEPIDPSAAGSAALSVIRRLGAADHYHPVAQLPHSSHALAAFALLMPLQATAQAWPVKPVRIIVPYPAGGTSDMKDSMNVIVAEFHRLRKLGVRYIPIVISGLIGNALALRRGAGAREAV